MQDLAPVAVVSDWAQQSQAKSLASMPQFHSFPQLAGSVLGSAGLPSPAACREVFSFDATSLVDVGAAQAALKRHLANLGTFRGRNLGALPLPPVGGLLTSSLQVRLYLETWQICQINNCDGACMLSRPCQSGPVPAKQLRSCRACCTILQKRRLLLVRSILLIEP